MTLYELITAYNSEHDIPLETNLLDLSSSLIIPKKPTYTRPLAIDLTISVLGSVVAIVLAHRYITWKDNKDAKKKQKEIKEVVNN